MTKNTVAHYNICERDETIASQRACLPSMIAASHTLRSCQGFNVLSVAY
jgi:hypothetical protein